MVSPTGPAPTIRASIAGASCARGSALERILHHNRIVSFRDGKDKSDRSFDEFLDATDIFHRTYFTVWAGRTVQELEEPAMRRLPVDWPRLDAVGHGVGVDLQMQHASRRGRH